MPGTWCEVSGRNWYFQILIIYELFYSVVYISYVIILVIDVIFIVLVILVVEVRLTIHCGLEQQAFVSVSLGQPSPRDAWDGVSKTHREVHWRRCAGDGSL